MRTCYGWNYWEILKHGNLPRSLRRHNIRVAGEVDSVPPRKLQITN